MFYRKCKLFLIFLHTNKSSVDGHKKKNIVILILYWHRPKNLVFSSVVYSVPLVRERTIPTERPPLVGEVIANFCG
jgi:hypothetical protein